MTDSEMLDSRTGLWRELRLCLGLLTRVPVRIDMPVPPSAVARASRWFPLVGALVGAASAGVLALVALLGLPDLAAALIAIGVAILLTGAIHEDGLADVADGFGGGFDRGSRLEIMRDSHAGAYGVIALVLSIGLKAALLAALLGAVLVAFAGLGALAARRIGGQTGDVLGAGQQVTEFLVLLGLTAVVL